jgi:hypothetical protein
MKMHIYPVWGSFASESLVLVVLESEDRIIDEQLARRDAILAAANSPALQKRYEDIVIHAEPRGPETQGLGKPLNLPEGVVQDMFWTEILGPVLPVSPASKSTLPR